MSILMRRREMIVNAMNPTPLSYIQNSLVYHYDAEWNGGIEIHKEISSSFKNLAGATDCSITNTTFKDKSVAVGSLHSKIQVAPINYELNKVKTISLVFRVTASNSYGAILSTNINETTKVAYRGLVDANNKKLYSYTHTAAFGWSKDTFEYGEFICVDVAVKSNGDYFFYVNGILQFEGTGFIMQNIAVASLTAASAIDIDFHNLRVYDRVLSSEEISINYNISKLRFDNDVH